MGQHRILTIDDNEHLRELLKFKLEALDPSFVVETANGGMEGLRKAKEFKPDVILLDFEMPGMTGLEVLKELKKDETTQQIPVLMLSGIEDDQAKYKTSKYFHEGFVAKPVKDTVLKEKIDKILQRIHKKT